VAAAAVAAERGAGQLAMIHQGQRWRRAKSDVYECLVVDIATRLLPEHAGPVCRIGGLATAPVAAVRGAGQLAVIHQGAAPEKGEV